MNFNSIRNFISYLAPAAAPTSTETEEEKPLLDLKAVLEESKNCHFHIRPIQFAHRVVPAYIENTSMDGKDVLSSLEHWIGLLSLWLENKALFFPLNIPVQDLKYLRSVLESYAHTKKKYHSFLDQKSIADEDYFETAKKTLRQIELELGQQKRVCYTPGGYLGGIQGSGHELPIKFIDKGKKVDCTVLTLGEGVQFNPEVGWKSNATLYHFQSFPIVIDKAVLFSEAGIEVFARLIRMQVESCPAEVRKYSSEDIYFALASLGHIRASFDGPIAERARKEQLGNICADKATVLIIHDVLIDLGNSKEKITRLFCLEKLCDLLFYKHSLEEGLNRIADLVSDSPDPWVLLKHGLKEVSVRSLKVSKSVLSEKELSFCYEIVRHLFDHARIKIREKEKKTIPLKSVSEILKGCAFHFDIKGIVFEKETRYVPCVRATRKEFHPPTKVTTPSSPKEVNTALKVWIAEAKNLKDYNPKELNAFVYKTLLSLPIPESEQGFWDDVPASEISEILESFLQLTILGINESKQQGLIYRNVLIFSIAYAIVDRLVRRKWSRYLKDFASPFEGVRVEVKTSSFFSFYDFAMKKENFYAFDFKFLHLKRANEQWKKIQNYFENSMSGKTYTLFAPHVSRIPTSVIAQKDDLLSPFNEWSTVSQHFKFLEQFFNAAFQENSNSLCSLDDQFCALLLNDNDKYVPKDIETLYFFANYTSWSFKYCIPFIKSTRVERVPSFQDKNKKILISFPTKQIDFGHNEKLGSHGPFIDRRKLRQDGSENGIFCEPLEFFPLKRNGSVLKIPKEWSRLFLQSSLQITSVIQWMQNNLAKLQHFEFQQNLEQALFEPGLLIEKVKQQPSILQDLRNIIKEAIGYFSGYTIHFKTVLFLVRLGACIESYGDSPSLEMLAFYEKHLLEQVQKGPDFQIYIHMLFLYQIGTPDRKSLIELINAHFWVSFQNEEATVPEWLCLEASGPLQSYSSQIAECFEDKGWIECLFNKIFASLFPKMPLPEGDYKSHYPYISKGDYSLDIRFARVFKGFSQLIYVPEFGLSWFENGILSSLDEMMQMTPTKQGTLISKRMPLLEPLGLIGWYHQLKMLPQTLNGCILEKQALFNHWILENQEAILIEKKQSHETYLALKKEEGFAVHKLLPNGSVGPVLVNMYAGINGLSQWLERLGDFREVCVWYNEGTGLIEEIDFFSLDISFKGEMDGETFRYRSVNFPEFFLAAEHAHPELDYFNGAIVLENEKGSGLLIPCKKLDQHESDFSTDVNLTNEFLTAETKFFFYHYDEIANVFVHPSPEANFFLALLFSKKRDYQKAILYLNRAKNFSYVFEKYRHVIETFYNAVDHSPEALAFYLRLSIHLIENATQPILEGYGTKKEKKGKLDQDFFRWVAEKFDRYVRICSTKEISRIPAYIKLSLNEESSLLQFLKPILTKTDKDSLDKALQKYPFLDNVLIRKALDSSVNKIWSATLSMRSQLVEQEEWSTYISPRVYYLLPQIAPFINITKQWLLNTPPVFSRTHSKRGFVRLTSEQVLAQFIHLYERARKGKAGLDIFYLQRSSELMSTSKGAYATLLQIVQKQPYEFEGLDFSDDPLSNEEVFKNIVETAVSLFSVLKETTLAIKSLAYDQAHFFAFQTLCSIKRPSLPTFEPVLWQFDQKDGNFFQSKRREVFVHFTTSFIESSEVPILEPGTPFAFPLPFSDKLTPIERRLMISIYEGYQRLSDPKYGKSIYRLKVGKNIGDVIDEIELFLKRIRKNIIQVKTDAEKKANFFPERNVSLSLSKMGENLPEITIEKILTRAYQDKDPMIIRRANPSLSSTEILELIRYTVQYHLYRIQIFQLERGLIALKEGNVQGFGESLYCAGEFNPLEEPEIYLYQSRTAKSLWKSQADVLSWEVETTKQGVPISLFSATAGEGKTTLYLPIAMKRVHRLTGLTPFSASPKALYPVDREGLAQTSQHIFSFEVGVFEVALSTAANGADFKWLYEQLTLNPNKGFKITPETYFALNLKYQLALETENERAVKWISKILWFFAHKGAVFIDECRVSCSPFMQAKIGIGKPMSLQEADLRLMIEIYRALVNPKIYLKDGRNVQDVVRLSENLQAMMDDRELFEVKEAVLSFLSQSAFFKLTPKEREEICDYWRGKVEEPRWHQKSPVREIDLVKIFFDEFYDVATKIVWKMNHVRSIKEGEEIHVLARNKQATLAYFEEVFLTVIATIQGVLQEGLTLGQAETLFNELRDKSREEGATSSYVSEIEKAFREWIGLKEIRLSDFSSVNANSMKEFHRLVRKNKEAIFWYLENFILKQIQYSPESLTVTPIHFLHAFKKVTLFSAGTGSPEIYGIYGTGPHIKIDSPFVSHAIHRFGLPENRQFLTFPPLACALDFFNALFKKDPALFTHCRMICDAGGLLRDFTAEEMVEAFFQFIQEGKADFDGMIIFEESSRKETETNLMLYLKGSKEPTKINGHDIPAALKSMGMRWEKLKLLTFIDPSHREGANIEQPKNTSVLVLLGEDLSISNAAQGVARGRGVLKKEQRVIWGASEKLMKSIAQKEIEPLQNAINWEVKNEEKLTKNEWLLSGCQQISFLISKPVWDEWDRQVDSPENQIKIWKKYRKGFVKKAEIELVIRFKGKRTLKDVDKALWEYAKECYDAFGYGISWEKAIDVHRQIAPVIEWIKKGIGQILALQSFDSLRQTYMHTYQKQEVKKEQAVIGYSDLQPEDPNPLPAWLKISNKDFVSELTRRSVSARTLFGSCFLSENLFFSYNAIHTAKSSGKSLKENYRKPVQYILFIKEQEKFYAFALADIEAAEIQQQLLTLEGNSPCALLGWNGLLVQNGRFPLTHADLKSLYVQDVLIDVGLSRWENTNPLRLCTRLEKWSDFWPMWQKIKQGLPQYYDDAHLQTIENIVPSHLKKNIEMNNNNNNNDPTLFKFF